MNLNTFQRPSNIISKNESIFSSYWCSSRHCLWMQCFLFFAFFTPRNQGRKYGNLQYFPILSFVSMERWPPLSCEGLVLIKLHDRRGRDIEKQLNFWDFLGWDGRRPACPGTLARDTRNHPAPSPQQPVNKAIQHWTWNILKETYFLQY